MILNEQIKTEAEEEGEMEKFKITDASTFGSAIETALEKFQAGVSEEANKLLSEAEKWLAVVRNDDEFLAGKDSATPDKKPGRWLDHREATLFRAYREIGDFKGARRIIDAMIDTPHALSVKSKEGRIAVLRKEMEAAHDK